jgi:hypothetical protein
MRGPVIRLRLMMPAKQARLYRVTVHQRRRVSRRSRQQQTAAWSVAPCRM